MPKIYLIDVTNRDRVQDFSYMPFQTTKNHFSDL